MRKPCCDKQETNKGAWSKEEDDKLIDYIKTHGEGCWRALPIAAGLHRCGKSCRLRWINYLRPDLKRGNFGLDEEDLIIKLHALLGNRWSLIAGRLPGRTDNEVKNYWNSHIKKKLVKLGVDPNHHRISLNLPKPPPNHSDSSSSATSGASSIIDLNLDLTIAISSSPSSSPIFDETNVENIKEWTMITREEVDQKDTLLLFT